jgi:hypothetical protein
MKTSKNLWVVVQSGTKMFNKKFFMPLQALPTRKKARQKEYDKRKFRIYEDFGGKVC